MHWLSAPATTDWQYRPEPKLGRPLHRRRTSSRDRRFGEVADDGEANAPPFGGLEHLLPGDERLLPYKDARKDPQQGQALLVVVE